MVDDGGLGGSGGLGSGGGGAGGELVGVAQEADGCCCANTLAGGPAPCHTVDPNSAPRLQLLRRGMQRRPVDRNRRRRLLRLRRRSGAGGANAVEVSVLLLALAAFRTIRRRFARG